MPAGATLLGEPLAVELMNTVRIDRGDVQDALSDDAAAVGWLYAVGDRLEVESGGSVDSAELGGGATAEVAGRLRGLRAALRRLAAETTDDPRAPVTSTIPARQDAIDTVNALAPAWPELLWPARGEPARAFRTTGAPGELAVSLIAHQAVELFAGAQRNQLRACLAPGCLLYFVKQHPRREWCSAVCGNRARVARHYQRHHAENHPSPTGKV
ncbi:CGNR zinc finger domain-containing protein [Pseudonocardia alaniniphila]